MVDFGSLPKNSLPPMIVPSKSLLVSIFFVSMKNLKVQCSIQLKNDELHKKNFQYSPVVVILRLYFQQTIKISSFKFEIVQ
jgi:hypothetical protein